MNALAEHSARPTATAQARRRTTWAWGLTLVSLLVVVQPALAQSECTEQGKNMQCGELGSVKMDTQRDIRGDPIDVTADIVMNTNYADRGARWFLFSVRNFTVDGTNPVTISLTRFGTDLGDIVTTRVEHNTPNELNMWVDGLDLPVNQPITLQMQIGCTDRGAFRLETLVMAFDRGYAPISDSTGREASLFSFTLLGVNKETSGVSPDGGSIAQGHKLSAPMIPLLGTAILAAVVLVRGRRRED